MDSEMNLYEGINMFKQQAKGFVAVSDRPGLKNLYSKWVAYFLARNKDYELEVMLSMREALREVLLAPSRDASRGRFDDM